MIAMIAVLTFEGLAQDKIPADVARAEKVLVEKPDDASANLTVGTYHASRGDWAKAVPCLSKSATQAIRDAALAEAKVEENGFGFVEIGDAWIKAAGAHAKARQAFQERAAYWYVKGYEKLSDDLWKAQLKEKLLKLAGVNRETPWKSAGIPGWWSLWDGQKAGLDGAAKDGRRSVRILQAPEDVNKRPGIVSPPMSPKPGATYTVTLWAMTDGTDAPGEVRVRFWDQNGQFAGQWGPFIPADTPYWKKLEAEVKPPPNAGKMDVQVVVTSRRGQTWIDGLSLKLDGKELLENGSFEK